MAEHIRVVDLETTGPSPPGHGVCEIGWQDLVRGADGRWQIAEQHGSTLVDPGREIPAVTQAVHHIIDEDVRGAPRWEEVAPAILRPGGGLTALAAHRASFEQRFCTAELTHGVPWICTWKCALRLWPDSPGFSNQILRYWRRPEGLLRARGLPVHRALPDAYVTAHLLRDMLAEADTAQLIGWSALPGLLPRVPFGEHRGTPFAELGVDALRSLRGSQNADIRYSATVELERRGEAAPPPPPGRQPELF